MIGDAVAHYRISGELGAGGMGVVYLATDTKLDRQVALKFLPDQYASNADARARFEREARATAALNHPNIVTIYEIDELDGRPYIAMEYVDGQTLRAYRESGERALTELLGIIRQIAVGLARAHSAGITHRDLKPDNILITHDGVAKIVDFGLAQVRGSTRLTQTGSTLGTVAYMSPEQIEGKDVDHRCDIWSLGVIAYELCTGHAPFARDLQQAMMYAILAEAPPRPSSISAELPPRMDQIILRALEKRPEDRYPHLNELIADLDGISLVPVNESATTDIGIVVLPFEDISPGRDNEYFSDGLTEEIIADLSRVHSLRVISRTSAMLLKGTDKDIRTIGRMLDVRYVLEGSVRKAGNSLRITAQLIEALSDKHIWADKYTGSLDDVFAIQEQVSQSIVEALRLKLTAGEAAIMGARPIADARAYDCYLRARDDIHRWSAEALERALRHLRNGLEIVGGNALLYAAMGYVYYQFVNVGAAQDEYIQKAEEYLEKSFALDPDSSHAHRLCAILNQAFKGDQQKAMEHFKRALAADPNDPDTLFWAGLGYGLVGRVADGEPLVKRLVEIDPLTVTSQFSPGWLILFDGRAVEGLAALRRTYDMDPDSSLARFVYTIGLLYAGHAEEALEHLEFFTSRATPTITDSMTAFILYGLKGDKDSALRCITDDVVTTARRDPQWSWHLSVGYMLIGDTAGALDWIENAVGRGFVNYPFLSQHEPFLKPLHGEKRFQDVLERAKKAWEKFRV